jgi:hypothetical protein
VIDQSTIVDGHATEGDSHATLIFGRETRRKTATLRLFARHSGESWNPAFGCQRKPSRKDWIPACAGMTS